MRIYQLFHAVIDRFVPMDDVAKNELQIEAAKAYGAIKADGDRIVTTNQQNINWNMENPDAEQPKPVEALSVKHRVIQFLEQWWIRYIIAASFVFIVPRIKKIINGEPDDDDGDDVGDSNMFEEFQEFQRLKNRM